MEVSINPFWTKNMFARFGQLSKRTVQTFAPMQTRGVAKISSAQLRKQLETVKAAITVRRVSRMFFFL